VCGDVAQCPDEDSEHANSSSPTRIRSSCSSSKPTTIQDSSAIRIPTQRSFCSKSPSTTGSIARRSSKCLQRSSFKPPYHDRTACKPCRGPPEKEKTAEKETDVKGTEPENPYMVQSPLERSPQGSVINSDHLSKKSSEGMRWISRSAGSDGGREPIEANVVEDEESKPTERGSQELHEKENAEVMEPDKEPVTRRLSSPRLSMDEPAMRTRARSSLPPAPDPSPIDRQFWIRFGFVVVIVILLIVVAAYTRSSNRHTAPNSTPKPPASHGDSAAIRHHPDKTRDESDDSGCGSLFSLSQCADSDMFG